MLTDLEYEILERIVAYGGYVTTNILSLYKRGLTSCRYWQILKGLTDKGYLKQHNFFMDSTEPHVYQVTKKACAIFGRGEAYMRKKHQTPLIIRYLIRAHFLFELAGSGYTAILFSPAERVERLTAMSFNEALMPRKFNKGIGTIQIEEYILTEPPYAREGGICIVHVEKEGSTVASQLVTLLDRYNAMILDGIRPVDFLVITETEVKAGEFVQVYNRRFRQLYPMPVELKGKSIGRFYQVRALCGV